MTASRPRTREVNKLIDAALHPLAARDPRLWVVDWAAHAIYELSAGVPPEEVARRWLRYGGPEQLAELLKLLGAGAGRARAHHRRDTAI